MGLIMQELTATNPDGTPKHDLDPDQVLANGALVTAWIDARSDGIIDQNDMAAIEEKLNATDMTEEQKMNFKQAFASSFGGSGIGFINKDGQELYGGDATAALLAELHGQVETADARLDVAVENADRAMTQLGTQQTTLAEELAQQNEELAQLQQRLEQVQNGDSSPEGVSALNLESLGLPGDSEEDMLKANIALKEAEIRNTESRINLLDSTVGNVQEQFADTMTKYTEAHQELQALENQRDTIAIGTPERVKLELDILKAQTTVDEYSEAVETLGSRAVLAQSIFGSCIKD